MSEQKRSPKRIFAPHKSPKTGGKGLQRHLRKVARGRLDPRSPGK